MNKKAWRIDVGSYVVIYEGEELPEHLKTLGQVEEIRTTHKLLEVSEKNNQTLQSQDKQEKPPPGKTRK